DFSRFAQSDFNHVHWINETLKSFTSDPNQLEQKVSDLVLQLQTQMKDVMQTLDHTCQEAIASIPRVLREIDAVRIDALALESDLKTLQDDNQLDDNSQNIVNSLVELDRTRRNAQSAADALRETDRWINLMQCIDELFEVGDIDQLCSNIEGMSQCLGSFIHLNDYDERVKQVDKYKNNLESLIAPKLIQSFDDLSLFMMSMDTLMLPNDNYNDANVDTINDGNDNGDQLKLTLHLINLLCRIGRENAARKYYTNWLKEQVIGFWDRSTCQTVGTTTTGKSDSLAVMVEVLPVIIQKLSSYQSKIFSNKERQKLNCLPIFPDTELNSDQSINSQMVNNIICFYALLICFFKGQLNAGLIFHCQIDQPNCNHHHHHLHKEQHQQKSEYLFPIELLMDFTDSLKSFQPFQTFTNSILNYQLIGCLFRVTVGCLQYFEELLIPFYSEMTKRTVCSKDMAAILRTNNNNIDYHQDNIDKFKSAFIELIQVFIHPFLNLPELFSNYISKQFDYKRNELNITVGNNNPSDVLEKLNKDVVISSISLFYDTIHLCFEETGAIGIPFILDIIQSYWDSLIANWIIWNTWIEKQLMKTDMELNYHQAYGFMWILKFAHLTGELTSQSDVFVEYVMSKCSNWLSFVLNSADNVLTKDRTNINFITNDNQINMNEDDNLYMPTISSCVLYQLTLKQSTDCQQAIHSLAHPSNLSTSINSSVDLLNKSKSIIIKSHSNLNGMHRSSSMLCRSTIGVVREIALKPIRYYLKSVPDLNIWFIHPNNGEECLPNLAYLPQDYITKIGQYLFMLPAQLEPYLSSMNDLNIDAQLNDQTIIPSLTSASDGLTHCFQLGDSDVIYSMISHKINDHSKHQQHQPGEEGKEQASSTQTKTTNMSTSSTRKRQLSSNFNQLKQMIMTDDNMSSTEISSVYCWLENLISVNVCDLIVNAILQIGMNKSVVNSSVTVTSATESMSKTSKALKSKSDSLKGNTLACDVNKIDDDDDDDDSVEDQLLLTKHGLKQLDVDLGYLFSMLHDLGVSVPSNLQTLRDLINCDADQFPKLCADRPPKIVNAVANFRGF
uniref:Conserved oligomeric Golgi complex subunit 7 n=1 Tax=Schistosoma mansoni TaxID=6183 RepID=A0A3Q0KVL2_SCHMA